MQTRVATAEGTYTGAVSEGAPALPPRISWGAVLAGGVVAVAVGAMLNVLGLAVGATAMEPAEPGASPTASLLGMAGGIWLLVANLVGLAVGGWVAARLSGTSDDTDGVLHGLSVWAIGFLLSAVLLGNVVTGAAGTAFQAAGSAIGGLGQGLGQAVQAAAPQVASADPQQLVDRLQRSLATGGDPAALSPDQRRAEIAQILARRVGQGGFEGPQRERLAQLVAAEYGIPAEEANARIGRLEAEAQDLARQAEIQARQAADAAADAAAVGAYWIFAAMILGAVAAVLGARVGTRRVVGAAHRYG